EINLLQLKMDENDHLGNAYEHLLAEFASDSGKKAGEFYTPSSVSELLANIVTYKKKRIKAYDPACGSGSLLIKLTKKINKVEKLCGQEIKTATYNLARMNFILRDMNFSKLSIKQGDTLLNPMHLDEENTFNCIVANPPFSLKWNPSKSLKTNDERFIPFPALAPNSYADFAFLQHMLYHVDPNDGIIASVFSLGVLNRQSPKAEKEIRKYIINKNYIDTIIFLPENLFYNTSIKTCIIIARKNKESQDKSIFMINAVNEFQSSKRQNILSKENIEKIFNVWKDKQEIENFSVKVSYEDIVSNDYSLSMNLYNLNDEIEEQEKIDIEFVESELKRLNKEINEQENLFQENLKKYLKNIN
uniref:type I restriction-modification system subunit M n=1 Tax=Mycoplasmopsis cricetuli TaxID=171283 RepID=UPI00047016C8